MTLWGIRFQKQDSPELQRAEKDLILLLAVEPLINIKKSKGLIFPLDSDKEGQSAQVYLKHIACHGESLSAFLKKNALCEKIWSFLGEVSQNMLKA